jgi:P27 family predicted phage terminase small subunit
MKKQTIKAAARPAANSVIDGPIPAPDTLSSSAKIEWCELVATLAQLGTAKGADLRALELLCECLATERQLRATLASEGFTIDGANDNLKAHPATKLLESTRNQCHRLLADFGLTPRGRLAVKAAPPKGKNPFAALIKPKVMKSA